MCRDVGPHIALLTTAELPRRGLRPRPAQVEPAPGATVILPMALIYPREHKGRTVQPDKVQGGRGCRLWS